MISAEFLYSKSVATRDSLLRSPQFYLVIFITSGVAFLFDLAKNTILLNYYDEPVTLLRRYLVVKSN